MNNWMLWFLSPKHRFYWKRHQRRAYQRRRKARLRRGEHVGNKPRPKMLLEKMSDLARVPTTLAASFGVGIALVWMLRGLAALLGF